MREGSVLCLGPHGWHRMRYVEWGDPANHRVLICVHGLTRNGRDFDHLARNLADTYRVVCPDIVGRGRSDWLADKSDYNYPVYCADLATLIARLDAERVDWVGTSMGGIIGMMLAALPGSPLRKLVLNDIGALIPKAALERIGRYLGEDPPFESLDALEAAMRSVSPFGELSPEQWRHLAVHASHQDEQGKWRFRYDPGIRENYHKAPLADIDLTGIWNAVRGPALVIRGESSDLLLPGTLERMRERPHTQTLTVPRTGHCPMLMDDFQVGAVRRFLHG